MNRKKKKSHLSAIRVTNNDASYILYLQKKDKKNLLLCTKNKLSDS